jgi:hypothetical protein
LEFHFGIFGNYIPVRIASTGSKRDAEMAGITPETSPMIVDNINPKNMLPGDNTNSKSPEKDEAMSETIQTKPKPTKPPMTAKMTASNKN